MSIKAIFYSKFDPQQGPKVIHQVPDDAILSTSDLSSSTSSILPASQHSLDANALISFPTVSRFVIPRQSLCGNILTLNPPPLHPNQSPLLLLTFPLCLNSPKYPRNEFIFNFSLVLGDSTEIDIPSYKSVLLKLSNLMLSLEEQTFYLSSDPSAPNTGPIYTIIESLMSDLNNYCECMIPIDGSNTLHLKLFPTLPTPPSVKPWHVPLFTVRIGALMDENWDLTMQRVTPYINGVNSVARIATLADADVKFTRKAIKHLLYYGCVLLLDIFGFNNIYAPTAEFSSLIATNQEMQKECARYVNLRGVKGIEEAIVDGSFSRFGKGEEDDIWPLTGAGETVDGVGIVQLFAALRQGLTVREWYGKNSDMLANIDLRRFITFGVIKGFLYRVHRYAVQTGPTPQYQNGDAVDERMGDEPLSRSDRRHELHKTGHDFTRRLLGFLDGTHCFDEICTDLEISEKDLVQRLEKLPNVAIICR